MNRILPYVLLGLSALFFTVCLVQLVVLFSPAEPVVTSWSAVDDPCAGSGPTGHPDELNICS